MKVFDSIRQADARRRVSTDVSRMVAYSTAVLDAAPAPEVTYPTTARWEGPIAFENQMTGDGRMIQANALVWDFSVEVPNLRFVLEDVGAHDGAVTVGKIDTLERRSGGVIWGSGPLDMASDYGKEAYRQISEGLQNGVSIDLDDVSFEIRVAGELYDEMNAFMEALFEDEALPEEAEPERDADGRVTVATVNSDDEVMVTTSARLRATTIVGVPAFAGARISIVDEGAEPDAAATERAEVSLVASAIPVNPPAAWFDNPNLSSPTPLTITPDGRVFGHAALWGTCHISHTAGGKCVTPPNSPSSYSWFHTGGLETAEGDIIAVGHLTYGTGHAGDTLTAAEAIAHYDNTGKVGADARMYEDSHGIAFAGALRPNMTPEAIREFRAAPVSGDWRMVGGALEMVGALAVNVPGFGVPRPHGRVHKDSLVSLVASGIVVNLPETTVEGLSRDDVQYLRSFIERERRADLDRLAARRNRVKVDAFVRRRRGA